MLREHGMHVTAQRLAVLRAVADLPHSTADDIYTAVHTELGAISRQTVYDALTALTDRGLLRRIQPAGSSARYETRVGDNHHHLVCRACGQMVDVDCAVGDTPCLTAVGRLGLRDRRGRGRVLGPLPRLRSSCPGGRGTRAVIHQQTDPPRQHRQRRTTDVSDDGVTQQGSESENPALDAPNREARSSPVEPGLVAEPARPVGAPPALRAGQPDGRGLRLQGGVRRRSTSRP